MFCANFNKADADNKRLDLNTTRWDYIINSQR